MQPALGEYAMCLDAAMEGQCAGLGRGRSQGRTSRNGGAALKLPESTPWPASEALS